jgi:hypothetical protein
MEPASDLTKGPRHAEARPPGSNVKPKNTLEIETQCLLYEDELDLVTGGIAASEIWVSPSAIHGFNPQPDPPHSETCERCKERPVTENWLSVSVAMSCVATSGRATPRRPRSEGSDQLLTTLRPHQLAASLIMHAVRCWPVLIAKISTF